MKPLDRVATPRLPDSVSRQALNDDRITMLVLNPLESLHWLTDTDQNNTQFNKHYYKYKQRDIRTLTDSAEIVSSIVI